MERSQQGLGDGHNDPSLLDEVSYPPLNLVCTQSLDIINSFDNRSQQLNPSHQERFFNVTDYLNTTSTPPATSEKPKAMNFPAFKITIGQWTYVAVYTSDILAKLYFAKKKLLWELLDSEETSNTTRLKKKIEIQWDDILSLRAKFHVTEETGILEVELRRPPTFFVEINPQPGKHTQWKQIDQDFTQNQSSICRRHQLSFKPGVLQESLKKLVSCSSFWSELFKVTFPLHDSIYFDSGYGNNNINQSLTYSNSDYGDNNINNSLTNFNIGYGSNNIDHSLTYFNSGYGDNNINNSLTYFNSGYGSNNVNNSLSFNSGYGDNNINNSLAYFNSGYGDNNINNSTYFNSGYGDNNINNSLSYNHDQILTFNNVDNANLNHLSQGTFFGHYPIHFIFESDLNPVGVDKGPDPVGVDEGNLHMANQYLANDGQNCLACLMQVCSLHFPTS